MLKAIVYTTPACSYCVRAKRLLEAKKVPVEEIDVSGDFALRQDMVRRAGGRMTVPQIFIGDTHVGGYEDLYELEHSGRLDPLLSAV